MIKDFEITEKDFESQIKELAELLGWKYYHTWVSIHSPAGFPDCVLSKDGRTIIAELKSNRRRAKLTPEQARWLWELRKTPGLEVYVWRPRHFEKIVEKISGTDSEKRGSQASKG